MPEVAALCGLPAEQLVMRFGLHWGSTIYMGNIGTLARSEVTALGDEVNEAARIEACATGGRILASKPLVERLTDEDATTMGIDPDHVTYTQLANLTTATDKARRDAPVIAVCELWPARPVEPPAPAITRSDAPAPVRDRYFRSVTARWDPTRESRTQTPRSALLIQRSRAGRRPIAPQP